jgi:hypothetical protein
MPQLTITPAEPFANATQEIYSKHSEINGVAELKLGNDIGGSKTFANVLKSENGKATFYGNNGGETKFMEYDPVFDKINITKDMDLAGNVLYIDNLYIQETVGTAPIGQKGSLTLVHEDVGGTSSIVFRSARDGGIDHGYISYTDDYDGNPFENRSLLEIGCQNDSVASTIDNIALMPSGFVGVNTRTPQAMLDVNGDMSCNGMTMNNVIIGERELNGGDGNGIMVKTLLNPFSNSDVSAGSIFEVQSQGLSKRLWVGQYITSPAKNRFMFGFTGADGTEGLEANYKGKLDLDGSVECTEIKVNDIPLNSFTNYKFGTNYNFGSWGKGNLLELPYDTWISTPESKSHLMQFRPQYYLNPTTLLKTFLYFTCYQLGTYEITANVVFRNETNSRLNPCIGIAVGPDDLDDNSGQFTAPDWSITPHNQTPFSVSYVRMSEGMVCSLSAKRIHHFGSLSDYISVKTYLELGQNIIFQDETSSYTILNATIQFKYIGNFENITG